LVPRPYFSNSPRALTEFAKNPKDAYWARRVCDLKEMRDDVDQRLFVAAVACVVSKEPEVVLDQSWLGVCDSFGLRKADSRALRAIERRMRIKSRSVSAHVKGRLWAAAMNGLPEKPGPMREFASRAWAHLQTVDESERSPRYREAQCIALAWCDYRLFLRNFDAYLENAEPYMKDSALALMLETSARQKDWKTYDVYRERFRNLPPGSTRAHDQCEVLNLDGLRSIARGENARLPEIMKALIETGKNVQFLGTPSTLRLVKVLAKKEMLLDECRAFLLLASANGHDVPRTFTKPLLALLPAGYTLRYGKPSRSAKRTK
jgi:hypothetical protein